MKKINRYISIITIAIATPLIMPLGAMKEQEQQQKEGSSIVIKNPVKTAFLLASQNSDNTENRLFMLKNLNNIDIETLEKSLGILKSKGKERINLYIAIQNKLQEKKRLIEKNKRKRNDKENKGKEIKKKKTNNEQKTDCPICLKNVHKGILEPVELPCKHIIHTKCLFDFFKKTLKSNGVDYSCPFCKKTIDLKVLLSLLDKKKFIPHTSRLDYQNHITKNIIKKQLNDGNPDGARNLIQSMALFSDDEIKTLFTNATRREEDSEIVKILLANKDIAPKLDFFEAFSEAVTYENITVLQELLKKNNFIKKTFTEETMNSLFVDAAAKNHAKIIKIFLTNNDINSSIKLDYFKGFYEAAINGSIESLTQFLDPNMSTKNSFYTNTIQPIVNYLKNKADSDNIQDTEIDSIQNYVSEVFPQDSKLNGYKEHLYYLFFIILFASKDNNNNHAKMIENTLKKDPAILTKIGSAQGQYSPYNNKDTVKSILFNAVTLSDDDILNLFLTPETINALKTDAQTVINDLFTIACESNACSSLETLFKSEIFNKQLKDSTITNLLSYAIKEDEEMSLDVILNQKTIMASLINNNINNKLITNAIEQGSYDALTTIIAHKNPTLARTFFESKAWEEEFMTALKDDNENLMDALLAIDKSILTESKFMEIFVINKDVIAKLEGKIEIFTSILRHAIENEFNSLFYICLYHGILSKKELQDAVDNINLEIEEKEDLKKQIEDITIVK